MDSRKEKFLKEAPISLGIRSVVFSKSFLEVVSPSILNGEVVRVELEENITLDKSCKLKIFLVGNWFRTPFFPLDIIESSYEMRGK